MEEEKRKEDFATIEPGLNRVFESNEKISPEFKEIARACFGRIFYMLGEKNFKRWIDMKQLNKQIKEIVIESMSKEDLEEKPITMGYYTRGKNRIRLSPKYSPEATKDVNIHETFHLMTDNVDRFPIFLNEGLTEYLKGMATGQATSYIHNVNVVKFLHEIFGDSLIKSYLIGKKGFDDQVLNLINYDNNSHLSDVKNFYSYLDIAHEYNYSELERKAFYQNGATPEILERSDQRFDAAKKNYDFVKPEILSMYSKIIAGRITEMTKNMEFYKNGENGVELDLESASEAIRDLMEKAEIDDFIKGDFVAKEEWRAQTSKLAAEQVLENTHVLVGYEGSERETRKQELIDKIAPKIVIIKSQRRTQETSPTIKNSDITSEENSNISSKLFTARLKNNMDITQYIETVVQIAQITGLSDTELDNCLTKYNIEYFGEIGNFKKINEVIHSTSPKIQKLHELEQKRNKDTITSEYKQIGKDRFIEKRDNQLFLVSLKENGDFSEVELKRTCNTFYGIDGTQTKINFSEGLPNLEVIINGKKINLGETLSLRDIKEMEVTKEFSKDIDQNIEKGKYTTILNDAENPWEIPGVKYSADIDRRTRNIDFRMYIEDLKRVIQVIPENQRQKFIKDRTGKVLDQCFKIPKESQDNGIAGITDNVEKAYTNIASAICRAVDSDSIGKMDQRILDDGLERLTNARKEMVEENEKTAVMSFEKESDEKRFRIIKKRKEEKANKKALDEEPKKFDYNSFYKSEGDVPLDEMPYHFRGVSTTQLIDSRNVKFLYKEFAENVKKVISEYSETIHEEMYEEIFSRQMKKTYLISSDSKDMLSEEVSEALNEVKDALKCNVFDDTEIDDEGMSESLAVLNNYKVEKSKEAKSKVAIHFDSKDTEHMFSTFTDLLEIVKKSGIKTDEVTETVKGIMASQMEKEDKQTNGPSMDDE